MPTVITRGAASAKAFGFSGATPLLTFNGFDAPAAMNGSSTGAYMFGVIASPSGGFVAVGYTPPGSGAYPLYATSSDGLTWTTPALMNGSTVGAAMLELAVNSAGKFVAVGYDASNFGIFATSTDGTNWTTPAPMGPSGGTVFIARSIVATPTGGFVVVGFQQGTNYPMYATSSDGTTWTDPALMNGSTTPAFMYSVALNSSGVFVAVGPSPTTSLPMFARSTDGSTWTTPAVVNGTSIQCSLRAITNTPSGGFLAVGSLLGGGTVYPVYATSPDGITWSNPITMVAQYGFLLSVTVNASGKYVAVGNNVSNQAIFVTSDNGVLWTAPALMSGSTSFVYASKVKVNSAGRFVAVGYFTLSPFAPMYAASN